MREMRRQLSEINKGPMDAFITICKDADYRQWLDSAVAAVLNNIPNSLNCFMAYESLAFEDSVRVLQEIMPGKLEQIKQNIREEARAQRALRRSIVDNNPNKYELLVLDQIHACISEESGSNPLNMILYVPRKVLPCANDNIPFI